MQACRLSKATRHDQSVTADLASDGGAVMGAYRRYQGYVDAAGRGWKCRRPNGWPIDDKAPDGFTVTGYRKIDQKLRIRFNGSYWTHPTFVAGRMVYCSLADALAANILGRLIDAKWTPDNIADDLREFCAHSGDVGPDCHVLEYVGEWNKRSPA